MIEADVLRRETTGKGRERAERFYDVPRGTEEIDRNPYGLPAPPITEKQEAFPHAPDPVRSGHDSDCQAIIENIASTGPVASYTELIEWKNEHGASVIRREDGVCRLPHEHFLDDVLKGAIMDNQELSRGLSPSDPESVFISDEEIFGPMASASRQVLPFLTKISRACWKRETIR